jgi:hypothetical protein
MNGIRQFTLFDWKAAGSLEKTMRPKLKSQVLCRTLLAGACRYAAIIQEDFHDSFENLGCLILATSELSLLFP